MSLLPLYRYSVFGDPFFYPIDFFDPWLDYDFLPLSPPLRRSFRWAREHERIVYRTTTTSNSSSTRNLPAPIRLPPPEKFRVQLDVSGFKPESVKTRIVGSKIIVEAKEENREARGDFQLRELRKSYDLPGDADESELVSHVGPNNILAIEVPIRSRDYERRLAQVKCESRSLARLATQNYKVVDNVDIWDGSDFQRTIIDNGYNRKQLILTVSMKDYQPDEIKLSVKFNVLIVRGEHRYNDGNRYERSYFFKTTTLPRGAQVDQIQSTYTDDGQLKIEVPFTE